MFQTATATAVVRCTALTLWCTLAAPVGAAQSAAPASSARPLPSSVRFIDAPSAESPAARQKRLKKECKGRPNAGACLGHTGRD
jgi:hypothetical protein